MRLLAPLLGILGFLGLWEAVTRGGLLPEAVPPMSEIAVFLAEQTGTFGFWQAIGFTLLQWAGGLLLAVVIGIPVGMAMGAIPLFRRLFEVPFEFLRPIPSVIYLPLVVLLLGTAHETAILLAAGSAVWPLLFNTYYGITDADPIVHDTGRAFGLTRSQRLAYITLPSVLPYAATGFRIAASIGLVVVVAVGLITGVPGLGQDLQVYATNAVYDGVYGLIVVTGLLGVLVNTGFQRVERAALKWHTAYRTGGAE